MVVHGRHRPGRNDEAEQTERSIGSAEEEPLSDATAHSALDRRLLVALWKPRPIGEEPAEERLDQLAGLARRGRLVDPCPSAADELTDRRSFEDVLVRVERRQIVFEVAHRIVPARSLTRGHRSVLRYAVSGFVA